MLLIHASGYPQPVEAAHERHLRSEPMRTVTVTLNLMSRVVGPVPNEERGPWDGTGDRKLVKSHEIPDDRTDVQDRDWVHVCDKGREAAISTYGFIRSELGYTDPLR